MKRQTAEKEKGMHGFTLLEMTVALAVLVISLLLIGGMFGESSSSLEYFTHVGNADTSMRRTLDAIAGDVQQAQPSGIAITSFPSYDAVTITRRYGENGTATVAYTVVNSTDLVRIETLPGPISTSNVVAHNLDLTGTGAEKGFRVAQVATSNLYTISLKVKANLHGGDCMTRTYTTTVGIRS
jgi:prepilin-type N-terminal cleavage/methylation domain-containing protein